MYREITDISDEAVMGYCKDILSRGCDKWRIGALLHLDCQLYQNTGKDTPKYEVKRVRSMSRKIYRLIRAIDETKGKLLIDAIRE